MMKILVTGPDGFIGKNVISRLKEIDKYEIFTFSRENDLAELHGLVCNSDFVIHLAGVNRPKSVDEFKEGNHKLTSLLCKTALESNKNIPVIFTSSVQAGNGTPYGESKLSAETEITEYSNKSNTPVYIFRLPGVIGKWCKPNYNSVVATFCYNISHNIPVDIHDSMKVLELVYIDDLVNSILEILKGSDTKELFLQVQPVYKATISELAKMIYSIHESRTNLMVEKVGTGLLRALNATYLSYLDKDNFSYPITSHKDERGSFVEMLKTSDSGQISYFSSAPGITRGKHYHHSKSEKFLIVKGEAKFSFVNIQSGDTHEICVSEKSPVIVESIPGWAHEITNTGKEEMIALLWANEIFDPEVPDTYSHECT